MNICLSLNRARSAPVRKANLWCNALAGSALLLSTNTVHAQCNILENGDFEAQAPASGWSVGNWDGGASTSGVETISGNNRYCHLIDEGAMDSWAITFYQEGISLSAGRTYSLTADIWSDAISDVKFQMSVESPFEWLGGADFTAINAPLTGAPESASASVIGKDRPATRFALQFGADLVPEGAKICFDNVALIDPVADPSDPDGPCPQEAAPTPEIRVNQHGFLPNLKKVGTYVAPETSSLNDSTPRAWALVNGTSTIASGTTDYIGLDSASGDNVHLIDFSSVTAEADNYILRVDDDSESYESYPFSISSTVFETLKYDALSYFYHNRSGVEIEASVVGAAHSRGASHVYDQSLDTKACTTAEAGCRTGVDVAGGWYDAGDHGKYVVNGGISVWTLMNLYERSKYLGANLDSFSDGAMALPAAEQGNGLPDLLDEAKWELDWMLKMQIPSGETNAGMVHHKLHDDDWTGTSFNPADATAAANPRHIWAPSTAATLNFAAVGAQCYRVYKDFDLDYAQQCLAQAITAYNAAVAYSDTNGDGVPQERYLRAPLTDFSQDGGGQYEDQPGDRNAADPIFVQDEFYWAATELYLAAGMNASVDAARYRADMQRWTNLHLVFTQGQAAMDWARVSGLGLISMATVGAEANADPSWVSSVQSLIQSTADSYVSATESEGYGVPFTVDATYWGSNSNVVNNMLIIGLARDFSCDDNYLDALQSGASYLLGRNPVGYSYITGYGDNDVKHPHHRFWSNSLNASLPKPPAGVMVGGANAGKEDPIAQAELAGCNPLGCYIDKIEAYSTNEITINWNAPLAWGLAYLDEVAAGKTPRACGGVVALPLTLTLAENGSGGLDLNALNGTTSGAIFQIVSTPQFGTASISSGSLTYTATGSPMADAVSYTVTVNGVTSPPAIITIEPALVQGGLSCTWTVTQDVNTYNGVWNASVLIENNTGSDIDGWSLDVTVGPENQVGSKYYDDGTVYKSGSANSESVWTISDRGWDSVIVAGGNLNVTMRGFDPGPEHWEQNHNGYTPADIRKIEGDCASVAIQTVDITDFSSYPEGSILTRNSSTQLHWYNETENPVYIEDESGNRLNLVNGTLSDSDDSLVGRVWVVEGANESAGNQRMETNVYALAQVTDLDISTGVNTSTITTGSGLGLETSSTHF